MEDLVLDPQQELKDFIHNVIVTDASVDMSALGKKINVKLEYFVS